MARNIEELFGGIVEAPHQIPYTYTSTNGGETFISLPFTPVSGVVTINGSIQVPLDNFELDGNTLNLGRELEVDDIVYCLFDKIMSPQDTQTSVRIYKFKSVGGETTFTPDFTAFGVQTLYIDGKYQVPGVDYTYISKTGVVSLTTPLAPAVWVSAEMTVKQSNSSLSGDDGASKIGTASGNTIQDELDFVSLNTREQWKRLLAEVGLTLNTGSFQEGGNVAVITDALWDMEGGKVYVWKGALPKNVPAKSTPSSTGGVDSTHWEDVSQRSLLGKLGDTTGGALVGLKKNLFVSMLSTTAYTAYLATYINGVSDYGMVADFDPSTGAANGTNNRLKLQQLLDDLLTLNGKPATVVIPAGRYFFNGSDPSVTAFGGCLAFGKPTNGLKNINFVCYGAEFYFGTKGRHAIVMKARDLNFYGLKIVGCAAGAITVGDENNACMSVDYDSHRVNLVDCYFCNSPGDQLYLGGSLVNGGETGYACRDIKVINCVMKERYGNGIRSYDASHTGTRSRLAIAVVDCIGLEISNNLIVGQIDLEPNLTGQTIQHAHIHGNKFRVGSVAGELTNGFREELMYSGTSVMRGGVVFTSPELPIFTNVVVENNVYEYGAHNVKLLSDMKGIIIRNETFERGCIIIGDPSGPNYYAGMTFQNNRCHLPLNGQDDDVFWIGGTPPNVPACMFWIRGNMAYVSFVGNTCGDITGGIDRMFFGEAANAGDAGRCVYVNNTCIVASTFRNFEISANSVETGSVAMKTSGSSAAVSNTVNSKARQVTPVGATLVAGALNWDTYKTSNLLVNSASAISITGITGGLGNGTELEMKLSGGSSNVTLVHSTALSLKGAVNAVLDSPAKVIMLRQIDNSGNWLEIYRNF